MNAMNILITTGIFPPDAGGPATSVPWIADRLTERGHRVTVVTLGDGAGTQHERRSFSLVRIRRSLPKPLRQLLTISRIVRTGRNSDVLFAYGLPLETVLAGILLGKPVVMSIVGDPAWERSVMRGWTRDGFDDFRSRRQGPGPEVLKAVRSWCARRARKIRVPSRYLEECVADWGVPRERITVVYNALRSEESTAEEGTAPVRIPLRTGVKFVAVGRLVPWKRIDAVAAAVATVENAGLTIVGDGPERRRIEALVSKLGMSDRVHFAGGRSRTETISLMAASDVFVLNSTYEGFPNTVLEAIGLGLPLIVTAAGGTPEAVRRAGRVRMIPPGDDDALRLAIEKAAAAVSRGKRGPPFDAPPAPVPAHLRPETVAEEIEKLLRSAARCM